MGVLVQKYGGSSLATLERVEAVADAVASDFRQGHSLVVVVSAMGRQTDELLEMAHRLSPKPERREVDLLLSAGERISMALLAIALRERGVPSLSLTGSQVGIVTDEGHGSARISRIIGTRLAAGLKEGCVVIVAGFQGVSAQTKDVTTLGRGGTDLSAVAIGKAIGADCVELFKDVRGIYSCDPKIFREAKPLPALSWNEMKQLADFGSKVVQSRAAALAKKYAVPMRIRSSFDWNAEGTMVDGTSRVEEFMEASYLKAVSCVRALSHLSLEVQDAKQAGAFMLAFMRFCRKHDAKPYLLRSESRSEGSGVMITLMIADKLVEALQADLKQDRFLHTQSLKLTAQGLSCIIGIGGGFYHADERMATLFALIDGRSRAIELEDDLFRAFCEAEDGEILLKSCAELCS